MKFIMLQVKLPPPSPVSENFVHLSTCLFFPTRYMCVRQSASDENLYLLADARIEALDKSLSQLKLFDKTNTDAMWKFVSDIQRDPYATALTAFSKITDKLIFRYLLYST